jgi:hypothetical protein
MADAQELLGKIDKRAKYRVVAQLDFDRLHNGKKPAFSKKTTFARRNICNTIAAEREREKVSGRGGGLFVRRKIRNFCK